MKSRLNIFHPVGVCAALILTGIAVYANHLNNPFQFDSIRYIPNHPLLQNAEQYFTWEMLEREYKHRWLLMATLAGNVLLDGFRPFGFHLVNLTIHIFNSLLVFCVAVTWSRKFYPDDATPPQAIGLFTALLFLAHPMQTESVIYVISRGGALATSFYLLGFLCFQHLLKAEAKTASRIFAALGIVACMILGFSAKQTLITLPALLFFYYLFCGDSRQRVLNWMRRRLPILIGAGLVISGALLWKLLTDEAFLIGPSKAGESIGRLNFMFTQPGVLVGYYLRLLFLPFNLNVDPDIPLVTSALSFSLWGALATLALLFALAVKAARRGATVYLFCLGWFLLVISPSSSIITLEDLAAERRVYLASLGLFFPCAALLLRGLYSYPRLRLLVPILIVACLCATTMKRNAVWSSESRLWNDTLKKSPNKIRPLVNLARAYTTEGDPKQAVALYERSLRLNPNIFHSHYNLGNLYWAEGKTELALHHLLQARQLEPSIPETHGRLGELYLALKRFEDADRSLRKAVELFPQYAVALRNLGLLYYFEWKRLEEGRAFFQLSLFLDPNQPDADSLRQIINAPR
ncbi:MAG: tetratricopeptide repeat protein [Candidatus Nitrohelix vancouverensis]|uniref:Tetratricopeptide repeat protein n=1 Tax=Candidatus Nitrohelix vancouverensis TaxID=2705534 RepID=A0A7T0G292_9BACT|nr:MAG: tetratricopeptide repeat protein [Candidatus Nitrohelix vancouverensis]